MPISAKIYRLLYLAGLAITVGSLPVSNFGTSVGLIALVLGFIIGGDWTNRWEQFKSNRPLLVALTIYAPLLFSAFYSSNMSYTLSDLRIWLPFLLIPPVIALSKPLNRKEFVAIMLVFTLSVLVATIIATFRLMLYVDGDLLDIRDISCYISHIRFALMINLAIAFLVYLLVMHKPSPFYMKIPVIACTAWFAVFLLLMQSLTGLAVLCLLVLLVLLFVAKEARSRRVKWGVALFMLCGAVAFLWFSVAMVSRFNVRHYVDTSALPVYTANGNRYEHHLNSHEYENGYLVNINICEPEMRKEWNRRSTFIYDGTDRRGQPLMHTLRRYLASKNLTRDSAGVAALDSRDVELVELGEPSVIFRTRGQSIYPRIYQLLYEVNYYTECGVVDGGSVLQRLAYSKAAWNVIKRNPLLGVGWGDVQENLNTEYATMNIGSKFWFMPHNQFLTVWVGAGLVGLLVFIIAIIFPFIVKKMYRYFLPLFFQLMILASMLFEDTFETHIGVAFTVIFGAIFIFGYNFGQQESAQT